MSSIAYLSHEHLEDLDDSCPLIGLHRTSRAAEKR
jgi:hypothetical protein